jgi:hypothetical protein
MNEREKDNFVWGIAKPITDGFLSFIIATIFDILPKISGNSDKITANFIFVAIEFVVLFGIISAVTDVFAVIVNGMREISRPLDMAYRFFGLCIGIIVYGYFFTQIIGGSALDDLPYVALSFVFTVASMYLRNCFMETRI